MNNHAPEYDDHYTPMYREQTDAEYQRELAEEHAYNTGGHEAGLGLRATWALSALLRLEANG